MYGCNWGKLEDEPPRMDKTDAEAQAHKRWRGRISVSDEELESLVGLPMDQFKRGRWVEGNESQLRRGHLYTIAEALEEHQSVGGRQRAGAGPFLARIVQVSDSSAT